MSVTSFQEVHGGRGGGVSGNWVRSYRRSFVVQTDSVQDDAATILLHPSCPKLYDVYAAGATLDLSAFCKRVTPDQDSESPNVWRVTAEYDTIADPRKQNPNPLLRPPKISWNFQLGTKAVEKAAFINATTGAETSDVPVQNSAGMPYDPPLEADEAIATLQIEKALADFDPVMAFNYTNAVNNDPWMGGDAYTWKCQGISGTLEYAQVEETLIPYWVATALFQYRFETWRFEILDAGFYKKNGGGTDLVEITSENGQPLSKPRLLDGSGAPLSLSGTPVYRKYRVYRELPFASLAIP